jgi:hypothetical protein
MSSFWELELKNTSQWSWEPLVTETQDTVTLVATTNQHSEDCDENTNVCVIMICKI